MSNAKAPSQQEILSAEKLVQHLSAHGLSSKYSQVFPDPPDFLFEIHRPDSSNETWAVEVTGLVQYLDNNGKEYRRNDFEPSLIKRCRDLEEKHRSDFHHAYAVAVVGPIDPKVNRTLEERIMSYVRSGVSEETALDGKEAYNSALKDFGEGADLQDPMVQGIAQRLAVERQKVTIRAYPDHPKKGLALMSMVSGAAKLPGSDEFVADLEASIQYAVDRMLEQKLPKLAGLTGYDRRVLLVWNDLSMAKSAEVEKAFRKHGLTEADGIDGVFFIEYGWTSISLIMPCADLGLSDRP